MSRIRKAGLIKSKQGFSKNDSFDVEEEEEEEEEYDTMDDIISSNNVIN